MTLRTGPDERGVRTLLLGAPERRNALSAPLVAALTTALTDAGTDPGVRAVVLGHTGTTFSAGADLKEPPGPAAILALLRTVVALPKPVVAAVTGHVRAGGLGLLGACDLGLAGPRADFAFTEARLGLAPAVISLPLAARLDHTAARRYYLTGERFDAAEAARIGLVTEAVADVDAALVPVLDALRACSPQGLAESKRLATATVLADFAARGEDMLALSAGLFASAEAREGMTAFLERRDPPWAR
ncbi:MULTISPECIES: enoyl-CoA hydratase family protein [Streptomyces]|uniref:Enoyl-CoA hydratase family protein n=1 Tax=Streptomyces evansiae TaxID=3075535 RepID=A0ABU2QUT6_9ACTN|nr:MULTISPECIES: enoyl-CoA hydratase family protein [unclassified Streptomyces]MDT0408212.1 enoyl-CoA hydratase family protein [Streptomyces sp. DSM 41979]MYQ58664.1 enoyl-CoA hydratase family protein [Streptomyces sp. SID4926]SCD99254.1 enoyl-CoA hydratase [Streptomyces sp. DfronAA-171]